MSISLTGAPQASAHHSTMHLAPIIERYMVLRRDEYTVLRQLDHMQGTMPLPIEEYEEVRATLSTSFQILRDPGHSALHETLMKNHAEYTALLAAMGNLLLEEKRKLEEMYNKGKYRPRKPTALGFSSDFRSADEPSDGDTTEEARYQGALTADMKRIGTA